jgi:Flp pilus assembly protein TadB
MESKGIDLVHENARNVYRFSPTRKRESQERKRLETEYRLQQVRERREELEEQEFGRRKVLLQKSEIMKMLREMERRYHHEKERKNAIEAQWLVLCHFVVAVQSIHKFFLVRFLVVVVVVVCLIVRAFAG